LVFESKSDSGGGNTSDCSYNKENNQLVIELEDEEFENALTIENVSGDQDEIETIIKLFENEKISGGGSIIKHRLYEKKNILVIQFKDRKTVESVLNYGIVQHGEKVYQAIKLDNRKLESNIKNKIEIIVNNVSENKIDYVSSLFGNEKKSDGGSIRKHNHKFKRMVIEFEDSECVDKTLKFGEIIFTGKSYEAEQMKMEKSKNDDNLVSSDSFNFKLIIKQTANELLDIDNESIKLYIALLLQHYNFNFSRLDYGFNENASEYIVISKNNFDFNKVIMQQKRISKLMDRFVSVEQIHDNGCIIVRSDSHADIIEMYFANEKVSGGGDIKTFQKINNFFIIEFEDKKCVNRVLDGRQHRDGMKVERFNDDISLLEIKMKENSYLAFFEIDINEFPFSFIYRNKKQIEKMREVLSTYELKLIEKDDKLQIEYQSSKLSNENLIEHINEFKKTFKFHEWTVETDILDKLKPKLINCYTDNTNFALIFEVNKIRVEGVEEIINGEVKKIECIINDDNNKKMEDKVNNLRAHQCSLLLKNGFITSVKKTCPDISIKIAAPKGTVTFNGFVQSVLVAKQKMWDVINAIKHKETEISYLIGKFLNDCCEYVELCLEESEIICEFEVAIVNDEQQCLDGVCKMSIYAVDEQNLQKTNTFINDSFIPFKIELEGDSLDLLDNLYPQFLEKIRDELQLSREQDHVIFISSKANRKVWCVGERLLVGNLSKRIIDFFDANTILKKYCEDFNNEDLRYLNILKNKEILQICFDLKKETNSLVSAFFEGGNNDSTRLCITGTKRMIERLKRELSNIAKKKFVSDYEIDDESVGDLFLSEPGRRNLKAIENESQCLIMHSTEQARPIKTSAEIRVSLKVYEQNVGNVKFKVVNSTIDKVEEVDVLTIASDSRFRPVDDSSKSVLNKAGDAVMSVVQTMLENNEIIFEGEAHAVKTPRFNVVFAVVPRRIENPSEIPFLKCCIKASLDSTSEFSSIAFPLFYTNQPGIKDDTIKTVVNAIISSIIDYLSEHPGGFKEIFIVDDKHSNLIVESLKWYMKKRKM
jgi:hypothetical protein